MRYKRGTKISLNFRTVSDTVRYVCYCAVVVHHVCKYGKLHGNAKKKNFAPQVEGGFTTPIGDPSYDLLETKIVTPEGENKSRVYRLQVEFTFD